MSFVSSLKKKMLVNYLKSTDPDEIARSGDKMLIPAFRRAVTKVPAYNNLLKKKKVDIKAITTVESFKATVPLIDKEIFSEYEIDKLCAGGCTLRLKHISVSSGFSGEFSYGLSSREEQDKLGRTCDMFFDLALNTQEKKTLFINCLGMGVKVSTSLVSAETSVRADMVCAIVKKIGRRFEQIIIIGNTYFLKKVIEDGLEEGIDWRSLRLNLIMGEDWFPENFRDYLAHLCGIDLDSPKGMRGEIGSTMGICELGLSLFQESHETIRIRRLAVKDERLRAALFGEENRICPILFNYHPYFIFLEELNGELVFTHLDRKVMLPLVRYASKDKGRIHSYSEVKNILIGLNYGDYVPDIRLPFVSVLGRKDRYVELNGVSITPEQVKVGIYDNFELAGATTGYFKMAKMDGYLRLEIQLKEGKEVSRPLNEKFSQSIAKYIKQNFEVLLYRYKDFPYGMELSYEKKFKYI